MTEKQLMIYQAIEEVLLTFAEMELGTNVELNNEVISEYLRGNGCLADYFAVNTKEECCAIFTEQILNGYPVWRMLSLPEWTMMQLEREFSAELDKREEEAKAKYACLTCGYYHRIVTEIGVLSECKYEEIKRQQKNKKGMRDLRLCTRERRKRFELKESCADYVKATEAELQDNESYLKQCGC